MTTEQNQDELRKRTELTPLKRGGSAITNHKLVKESEYKIRYRPSVLGMVVFLIAFSIGIIIPLFGLGLLSAGPNAKFDAPKIAYLLFGLIVPGITSYFGYRMLTPRVFDKKQGYYWKGWKSPSTFTHLKQFDNCCSLSNIHAIQLLAEYVSNDDSGYHSFELNLVLKDGSRLNVIDHGGYTQITEDAHALSEFLGVPVWDTTR